MACRRDCRGAANSHVGEDISVGAEGEHHLAKLGDVVRTGIEHELINNRVAAGQLEPRLGDAGRRHTDTAIAVAQCIEHDSGRWPHGLERPEACTRPSAWPPSVASLAKSAFTSSEPRRAAAGRCRGSSRFHCSARQPVACRWPWPVLQRLAGALVNHAINSAFVDVLLQSATLGLSS